MHHSARPLRNDSRRLRPVGGTIATGAMAVSAASRSELSRANHCGVDRKMTGVFERQSYGYL